MKVEQLNESKDYRKAARNLLTAVGKLMDEADQTDDSRLRYNFYLKAMSMSDEAYKLLGKAREFTPKTRAGERKSVANRTN